MSVKKLICWHCLAFTKEKANLKLQQRFDECIIRLRSPHLVSGEALISNLDVHWHLWPGGGMKGRGPQW